MMLTVAILGVLMAKSDKTKAKDALDKIFSMFIRLRDADEYGYCECCSCGKRVYWREIHAGHWIIRKYLSTRWDELNVHAQCCGCNTFGEGNSAGYAKFMLKKYGSEVMDDLLEKKQDHVVWRVDDYKELIEVYKAKVKALKKIKNII